MKLVEGKSYKSGFLIFAAMWLLVGGLFNFLKLKDPEALGFGSSILLLVVFQAYSGVALDQYWMASVSRLKQPVFFWLYLFGQMGIAVLAVLFAGK